MRFYIYINYGVTKDAEIFTQGYQIGFEVSRTLYCESRKTMSQGFFQQFLEKAPGQNWEKMINLTSKLGEIYDIEHNKGTKIYPQNQVILYCIMSSIPLMHKCFSIILIWVIDSHK